jgi:hypothetical protein
MKKNLFFALVFLSVNSIFAQLTITTEVCNDASSVRITGPWWGWNVASGPEASDNGDGSWTFLFNPAPPEDMEYLLVVDGFIENLIPGNTASGDWSCTPITDQSTYANRQWLQGSGDVSNVFGTCNSCTDLVVYGCTNPSGINYNENATEDDGTCLFGLPLPIDFESNSYTFSDFDGASSSVISNPNSDDVNSSENVVEHIRNGGQNWAGTYLTTNPIDFSASSIINIKVHSPQANIPLKIKLQALSGANYEISENTTVANQWEVLSFDFTGQASDLFVNIVIIFNQGVVGDGSANSTYYFDDIAFATGPILGCTDDEANNYNPSATQDDGSCTYGTVVLKITANPCVQATSVRLTGPFWGWSEDEGPEAVQNSNGSWTFTFEEVPSENMEYLLIVDGVVEDLVSAGTASDDWSCTPVTNFFDFANRLWTVGSGDVTDINYGTCGSCGNDFSMNELESANLLYPNPSSDFITLPNTTVSLEIYSITGQRVANVLNTNNTIAIAHLPMGIYTIKLIDGNGNATFNKFVKENK